MTFADWLQSSLRALFFSKKCYTKKELGWLLEDVARRPPSYYGLPC